MSGAKKKKRARRALAPVAPPAEPSSVIAQVEIPYRVVHEVGNKKFPVTGVRTVSLVELPEGHHSEMWYEVRISHHDDDDEKSFVGYDEVHRFGEEGEDSARQHFEAFVIALAGKVQGRNLLEPVTYEGRTV